MFRYLITKPEMILIVLFSLAGRAVAAQKANLDRGDTAGTSGKNHFLWFKGHWTTTKKDHFITDESTDSVNGQVIKYPGGTTLTRSKDGSVTMSSKGVDEWNKKVEEALKKTDNWEKGLDYTASDLGGYHLSEALLPDVKADKERYTDYKIDTRQDILQPDKKDGQQTEEDDLKKQMEENHKVNTIISDWCFKNEIEYNTILKYYKDHKNDKLSDLHNPAPPQFDTDCGSCDSALKKRYDAQVDKYLKDFGKPETDMIRKARALLRGIELYGQGKDAYGDPEYNAFKGNRDPAKKGACAYLDAGDLGDALNFLSCRLLQKGEKLLSDNKDNFKAFQAVARTYLACKRESLLLGIDDQDNRMGELAALCEKSFNYMINRLDKEHDWRELANFPFMAGLLRQMELLTGNSTDAHLKEMFKTFSDLLNNFHITVEMDIKVGKDGGYLLAHLKGESKISIDFEQKENQCYHWMIVEDQPVEYYPGLKLPVKKMNQQIEMKLITNEMTGAGGMPVYTGTKKYFTTLKNLRMEFCHPGNDSIILTGFIASPDARAGTWKFPTGQLSNEGIHHLDHFFIDIENMQEQAQSGRAEKQAEIMKKEGEEMKKQMEKMAGQMKNLPHTRENMAKYIEAQKLLAKGQDLGNNAGLSPLLYLPFQLSIQNNSSLLADEKANTFDAKKINPGQSGEIVYGYYKIRIEYRDPSGRN